MECKDRYHLVDMNSILDDERELNIESYERGNVGKIVNKLNDYEKTIHLMEKSYKGRSDALQKERENIKKHETTKHYLTLELSKGVTVEGTKEGFFIEGPLRVEVIDSKTLRIHKREE